MSQHLATFRFYAALNDFLQPEQRKRPIAYFFRGNPGIKDPVEVLGVPHSEVDLILANGQSVGFDYKLQEHDYVSVYPMFAVLDISPMLRLRPKPLRVTRFVVDVNLGRLARYLRLLGFDTAYQNNYSDRQVVDISVAENRIILTRDRRLLFAKRVSHGYWVRATDPDRQVQEVMERLDLTEQTKPFSRCSTCNGVVEPAPKQRVLHLLEPKTRRYYDTFFQCDSCGRVYWRGTHFNGLSRKVERSRQGKSGAR